MARLTGKLRHGLSFHCWGKEPLWFPGPRTPQIDPNSYILSLLSLSDVLVRV